MLCLYSFVPISHAAGIFFRRMFATKSEQIPHTAKNGGENRDHELICRLLTVCGVLAQHHQQPDVFRLSNCRCQSVFVTLTWTNTRRMVYISVHNGQSHASSIPRRMHTNSPTREVNGARLLVCCVGALICGTRNLAYHLHYTAVNSIMH